jgi:hypothetical protein
MRGHLGRLEYHRRLGLLMENLNRAATKIQAVYRGHLKRIWCKDAKLHIAATVIQCLVRKRIAYNHISELSYATYVIQSFCRMCVARIYAGRAMRAVILIQSTIRRFLARRNFQLQRTAALKIQSVYRMVSAYRSVFFQIASVWCLQSVVRMWLVRRRFLHTKRAAIIIQKYVRRQQALASFMNAYFAVINSQRFIRGYLGRMKYRISYVSILMIQTFFRMTPKRRLYLHFRHSIIRLQAIFRGKCASTLYLQTVKKIVLVQALVRRFLSILRKKRELNAIVVLQSFGRMINQKRKFDESALAAITIQTCMRRKLYRKRFLIIRSKAAIIQALFRRAITRMYKKKAMAAIAKLQSFGRMLNKKREYEEMYIGIVTVQSVWRRKLALLHFHRIRSKIIKVQAWVKMHQAMALYYYHLAAAIAIQSFARRVIAVCRLKYAQLAAICIQTYGRRFLVERKYHAVQSACRKLQPTIRMFLCRQHYRIALRAQTIIAKCFRGHRKYVQFQSTVRSLILVQRCAKRFINRVRFRKRIHGLFNVTTFLLANKDKIHQQKSSGSTKKSSSSSSSTNTNADVMMFINHLQAHPEDRLIRFAANDFCTLGQSMVTAKQHEFLEQLHLEVSEAFDIDKFARNAAHFVGMYPSMDCLRVYMRAINSFKYHHHGVMGALDEDDEDNDNDENDGNENIKQLKQALNMSVGNSKLKQGWLKKKRGGWNWQKRWFVLTEDYIIYYKNPQSINNPKFAIPLEGCTVQRSTGMSKEPIIELTSPNMGEKKKLFGGSKNIKTISFLAETEKELQEWLMPLKAVAGVDTLRESPPVQYVHTELCQLWVAAVDKNLETPLHLLVRYHCLRQASKANVVSEQKNVDGANKAPARRVSVIQRIKQSIVAQKGLENSEDGGVNKNGDDEGKDVNTKKYSPDDPYKIFDRDVEFTLEETIAVLSWFVEFGCPINGQNYQGDTALHIALQHRADPKLVRALLLKGADPKSFKNDQGIAPFDLIGTNADMRGLYMDVFTNSTKNIGALFKATVTERTYAANTKLKGYSYLSIFFGHQTFDHSK